MGDTYVECLVSRERNMGAFFLRIVVFALCGICVIFSLGGMAFLLVGAIIFGVLGVFVCPNPDIEYEYLLVGKELSVDKIIAKSKRKTVASYDLEKIEVMCPSNSHELDRFQHKNLSLKDYSSARVDAKSFIAVYHDEKQECLIKLEPNQELLKAMKSYMPRKVVEI